MNNKLIINTNLLRKESEFKTYTCVVEKAVPVPNELKTLNETGIISISLEHSEVSIVDEETGARIAESASVTINKNGAVSTVDISEFWFPVNSSDTTQDGVVTAGNVPNIIQAVNDDESGELLELFYGFVNIT